MYQNGKTYVNFLTPVQGSTEASASYVLGLTHFTCGNKKMCVNNANGFPVASNLDVQVLGVPRLIPNTEVYCCDIRVICDLTYEQVYGCGCCPNTCLQTEKIVAVVCVPVTSADIPTVSASGALADPANVACGCSTTNECTLNVSFTLETAPAANQSENNG